MSVTGGAGDLELGPLRLSYVSDLGQLFTGMDTAVAKAKAFGQAFTDATATAAGAKSAAADINTLGQAFSSSGTAAKQTAQDFGQAKVSADQVRAATIAYKEAMTQLRTEQVAVTQALGQARTATETQRAATEQARTSAAQYRAELAALRLETANHTAAHAPLQSALSGTNQLVQSLTMNMGSLGQGMQQATMAAGGFSGPMVAAGVSIAGVTLALAGATKAAVDWQTTLNTVSNNTQMTTADTAAMDAGVKQLGQTIPVTLTAMAEGWRFAADEGFSAADSMKVVAAGAEAAANTGAQATEVINTLAKALHDYHIPASDAMLVTNMLVEGAKQGQTTFAAMSDSIGPLIAQAASMHVPLTDIVAAMSAMTQNGYPADQAVTGLTNLLKEMIAPSQKARDAMASLGPAGLQLVDAFTPAGLAANGLAGNIKLLTEATAGDAGKILEILPQLRGYRSGLVLAGSGADDFTTALQRQADVLSGKITPTQDDFARTIDTVGAKMQILRNTVQVLAIDLGTVLLPIVIQVVQWLINLAQAVGLASGASGFVDIKQQIDAVNKSFLDGKAATDAYNLSQAALKAGLGGTGTAASDAAQSTANLKTQTAAYEQTADTAATAIIGLNAQLATNKTLLDANAAAIQKVKDTYDPTIASATESIRRLNVLTPEELARKTRELELDRDKAALELRKPDTSAFDAKILSDQNALDQLPALDTSQWDTAIGGAQSQITALQDAISGLNTQEFDDKIQAIRDKLAEPPPNTQGIVNQMTLLQGQLAGKQISQAQFNTAYGALSQQKSGIDTQYQNETFGLQGQLKLLEQERADQRLANQETARADKARIDTLKDFITTQTAERTAATNADTAARKKLTDDIKDQGLARTNALAPYTAELKRITDEQTNLSNLDKAASTQRLLDIEPYKRALDGATEAKRLGLIPLDAEKTRLDDIRTKLTEARSAQEQVKQEALNSAAALKDQATNAGTLADNLKKALGFGAGKFDEFGQPYASTAGSPQYASSSLGNVNQYDEFGHKYTAAGSGGFAEFADKLKSFGDWVSTHGDQIKDGLIAISIGLAAIAAVVAPGAVLAVGLAAVVALFIYDYNTNPTFKKFIDDITNSFSAAGDAIDTAYAALRRFLGLPPQTKQAQTPFVGPLPLSSLAANDPGFVPAGGQLMVNADGTPIGTGGNAHDIAPVPIAAFAALPVTILTGTFQKLIDVVKGLGDGGPAQQAQSQYTTQTATVFGIDSPGVAALAGYIAKLTGWFGTDGDVAQSLGSTTANFHTAFDPPGIPSIIAPFIANAATIFGKGGTIDQMLANGGAGSVPQILLSLQSIFQQNFGEGSGFLRTPLTGFATFAATVFGPTGSLASLLTTQTTPILTTLLGIFTGHFGTTETGDDGTLRTPFAGFRSFLTNLFKSGGSLDSVLGAFGNVLSAAMPNDIAPIQSFINGVGKAIQMIGGVFKLPDLAGFVIPTIGSGAPTPPSPGGTGGGPGRGASTTGGASSVARDAGALIKEISLPGLWDEVAKALFSDSQTGMGALLDNLMLQYGDPSAGGRRGAVSGGISPVAPASGGGWPDVLAAASASLGSQAWFDEFGNTLCEGFSEQMERNAGFSEGRWPSAAAHGYSVTHNPEWPGPPGSMMHWGTGYWPVYGHAGISVGDGTIISTSPHGIAHYSMAGANDYLGWVPPGLAAGGLTIGGSPRVVTVGDGPPGEKEWHLPEPKLDAMLRAAVRSETPAATGTTFIINDGVTVIAQPGHEADAWAAMEAEARRRGIRMN